MSMSNARMEYLEMPQGGWNVETHRSYCPCRYFFKYGCCVHLRFALQYQGGLTPWETVPKKRLKNRTVGKRAREGDDDDDFPQPGRPLLVGFALSFD